MNNLNKFNNRSYQRDQNLDATSCGWWCISFLYFMNNTKGPILDRMKKFDKKFNNKKTIDNEIDLKNILIKYTLNNIFL
jgi:hypothetical protein